MSYKYCYAPPVGSFFWTKGPVDTLVRVYYGCGVDLHYHIMSFSSDAEEMAEGWCSRFNNKTLDHHQMQLVLGWPKVKGNPVLENAVKAACKKQESTPSYKYKLVAFKLSDPFYWVEVGPTFVLYYHAQWMTMPVELISCYSAQDAEGWCRRLNTKTLTREQLEKQVMDWPGVKGYKGMQAEVAACCTEPAAAVKSPISVPGDPLLDAETIIFRTLQRLPELVVNSLAAQLTSKFVRKPVKKTAKPKKKGKR